MDILPDPFPRERTCCFTGHRILAARHRDVITAAVDRQIKNRYDNGYRWFLAGGAVGFDMLAETEVLRAARFDRDIKLVLVLPCRDYTSRWQRMPDHAELLRKHQEILGQADYTIFLNNFYTDTCMWERNRFLIDHSSACIAYYSGSARSGAGQTYRMARADGLDLFNVWEDVEYGEYGTSGL